MSDLARASHLIRNIAATPRPAGSEAEARARGICAEFLRARRFDVREEPFTYGAFPGKWGLPLTGLLLLSAGTILLAGIALGPGTGALRLTAFVLILAPWPALGVVGRGWMRRTSTNLVATRGGPAPRVWLCAHIDTKSQPIPTLVRTAGVIVAILSGAALVAAYLAEAIGFRMPAFLLSGFAVALLLGAVPLAASTVGAESPGAVDNATGVAAVLLTAESTGEASVGVVLTSAEELRLAGAAAWARSAWKSSQRPRPELVVNCDTLDDAGELRCLYHSRNHKRSAEEIVRLAAENGIQARLSRYTPGIMVDSAAIGAKAVTLSRVTL